MASILFRTAVFSAILLAGTQLTFARERLICAGGFAHLPAFDRAQGAAKLAARSAQGTPRAMVIFARFRGEDPDQTELPTWAQDIFDPDLVGSFAHFYDTMSFGHLQVSGEVAPRRYEAAQPAMAYLADDTTRVGEFAQFSLEVLRQADADIDFARFDNDGPDGVPNSGDDDGVVDAVFIVLASTPSDFIVGAATGLAHLGFEEDFVTDDVGANGEAVRIDPARGTLQQGRTFAEAVGSMCHEYGHLLGLPDLYNVDFLRAESAIPEEDSAGIGAWGLMGWGTLGWQGDDGPTSLCAWSRWQLGWVEAIELTQARQTLEIEDVGRGGKAGKVALSQREFFLLEYRTRESSPYDRHIPAEGLLVWHVERTQGRFDQPPRTLVDLECADGRWRDAVLDIDLQSGIELTLHAVDEEGGDIAGVGIGVSNEEDNFYQSTNTQEGGRAAIHVNTAEYSLQVHSAPVPYLPATLGTAQVQGDTTIRLVLEKGVRVSGRFLDGNGEKPDLGNRTLSLFWSALEEGEDRRISLFGSPGRYELGLKPGRYRVEVRFSSGEFPSQSLGVVEVREDMEFDFVLRGGVTLSGRIIDGEDGRVNGSIRLVAVEDGRSAVATLYIDGEYTAVVFPGAYRVSISFSEQNGFTTQFLGIIEVEEDKEIDLRVRARKRVPGRVVDGTGAGISGILIRTTSPSIQSSATSESDGTFALRLPEGEYTVSLSRFEEGGNVAWVVDRVRVPTTEEVELQLPSGARLSGLLVDGSGKPVEGSILLTRVPRQAHQFGWGLATAATSSDADGRYAIELTPDTYAVVAYRFDDASALGRVIDGIEVQGEVVQDLVLSEPEHTFRLSGDINREEVASDVGIVLQFYEEDVGVAAQTWVAQGERYEIDLPPGQYWTSASIIESFYFVQSLELEQVELSEDREWDVRLVSGMTAVVEEGGVGPSAFALEQNYPNPFNSRTVIVFQLPRSAAVELDIYNISGQLVQRLVRGNWAVGKYQVMWDGMDEKGKTVGSGVYFYRLQAGEYQQTRRLVLLK